MFAPFLAATIIGAGAVKFGAMSAMLSVLTIAIQILIIALIALGGFALWQVLTKKP
jgi:hypothetical protein